MFEFYIEVKTKIIINNLFYTFSLQQTKIKFGISRELSIFLDTVFSSKIYKCDSGQSYHIYKFTRATILTAYTQILTVELR